MAKKPTALTPGPKGGGKGKGGKGGKGPPPHAQHHHPHHPPSLGGPLTPGGGHTGAPVHHKPPHKVHHAKPHPKAKHHPKAKAHPKRGLAGAPLDGGWILGGNDVADNCALVAVANALLLSSGLRVPDAELLRIHDRAGPLSIPEALAALGCRASSEVEKEEVGLVIGVATPHGPHAGLLLGGDLVTWGGVLALPDDWDIEECWAVTW